MLKKIIFQVMAALFTEKQARRIWLQLQRAKNFACLLYDRGRYYPLRFQKCKKIIMLCTQEHGNMGDQAIGIAQLKWLRDNYPEYRLIEVTEPDLCLFDFARLELIKQILRPEDLIFLQGGGDLGDRYRQPEECRRRVIAGCRDNIIVIFPKTICFSDSEEGRKEAEISGQIYNSNPNVILTLRDLTSYRLAQQLFPNNSPLLIPDIVLYLTDYADLSASRDGILLCFREDREGFYSQSEKERLRDHLKSEYGTVDDQDTELKRYIPQGHRETELKNLLGRFAAHKAVVTDRFHGVVFSVITRTPCVALRSLDHKIVDGVKWFEHLNFVFLAEDPGDVPEIVKKALGTASADAAGFNEHYAKLRDLIAARTLS